MISITRQPAYAGGNVEISVGWPDCRLGQQQRLS